MDIDYLLNPKNFDIKYFFSLPLLMLFIFGSGFLFLWGLNGFTQVFIDNMSALETLLVSLALSPILMILHAVPGIVINKSLKFKTPEKESLSLIFVTIFLFSVVFAATIAIGTVFEYGIFNPVLYCLLLGLLWIYSVAQMFRTKSK